MSHAAPRTSRTSNPAPFRQSSASTTGALARRPALPVVVEASPLLQDELWEELADEIADNERKRGTETVALWDRLPSPPLRLYEVVDVLPGRGIVVEETTNLDGFRFEITSARAARVFRVGDTFGLGQNDQQISIWAPDRAYRR